MKRLSTLELFKENMKFSAGHFTIFSSTERENLHGHNYNLYVAITTEIEDEGLSFDYRLYKDKFRQLCRELDETVIIAGLSKHLSIEERENHYHVTFNHEEMIFLKRDAKVLPIRNSTVEELSHWFINQITADKQALDNNRVYAIQVKIFSAPGQCGSSEWKKNN